MIPWATRAFMRYFKQLYSKTTFNLKKLVAQGIGIDVAEQIIRNEVTSEFSQKTIQLKDQLFEAEQEAKKKTIELKDQLFEAAQEAYKKTFELKDHLFKIEKESRQKTFELLKLQTEKAAIEAEYFHTRSMLTVRHLLEKMEDRIGNPNKPRRERWIHFMTNNASINCIEILKKCFEDNLEQYTPEAFASQIVQIYSSLSSLIHSYDTYRVGLKIFSIKIPENTTTLQECLLKNIISSPEMLGFANIEFNRNFLPENNKKQ